VFLSFARKKGKKGKKVYDDKAYNAMAEILKTHTKDGVTDRDKVIADNGVTDITSKYGYSNSQLLQVAAMAYNEGENTSVGKNSIINVLMNRESKWNLSFDLVMAGLAGKNRKTGKYIAGSHAARMKCPNYFARYIAFFNSGNEGRNKNSVYKSCVAAAVNTMTGGKDFSNGSLYWHGNDFFSNSCQGNGKDWDAYVNEYLPKGFKWASDAIKNSTPPSYYYETKGSSNNDYLYLGKAYYGKNTFMTTKNNR